LLVHEGFSCFGELCSLHSAKREQGYETENRSEAMRKGSVDPDGRLEVPPPSGGARPATGGGKSPIAERKKSKRIEPRMTPSGNEAAMLSNSGRNLGRRERKGNEAATKRGK